MCNFFSVLIRRDGSLCWHWNIDSHSDLIAHFALRDDSQFIQHFAKAELRPDLGSDACLDAGRWAWTLDEPTRPEWLTPEIEQRAEAAARRLAESFIIRTGTRRLIVDGVWLIGGDAVVSDVRGGRIITVRDSASIRDVRDSASIRDVRDSASIHGVRDSASIHGVWDSASIHGVRDSASIRDVWGNASIRDVWGNASIHGVRGSASISDVGGCASIHGVSHTTMLDESARRHLVLSQTATAEEATNDAR